MRESVTVSHGEAEGRRRTQNPTTTTDCCDRFWKEGETPVPNIPVSWICCPRDTLYSPCLCSVTPAPYSLPVFPSPATAVINEKGNCFKVKSVGGEG